MKLIFLDVDGVLNHYNGKKSYTEHKKWHLRRGKYHDFNAINVRWVKKFLNYAIENKYDIVISSSWRDMELCMVALKDVLGEYISSSILCNTGKYLGGNDNFNGRELEIIAFLNQIDYKDSIVLDDEVNPLRMNGFSKVIKTSCRKGFRRKHYKIGLKIINKI